MNDFLTVERNDKGRDFAVGDIHGTFNKLSRLLKIVNFDPSKDRLFSVGDLVDRGPDSEECLSWLNQPWFFAVAGNHEMMAVDAHESVHPAAIIDHAANGGQWFAKMDGDRQAEYVAAFKNLPLAIEVPVGDKLCGIVHAEPFPDDWNLLRYALQGKSTSLNSMQRTAINNFLLWSRDRLRKNETKPIANVDVIFTGHTPVKEPVYTGNVFHIDTGAVYGRKLTIVNMDTMEMHQLGGN